MTSIKIFSDFACPFCYIGFAIAEKLKKENSDIHIEWIPYELDPDLPIGGEDLTDHIPQKQIAMSYRRIERLGSEYNLVYNNKTKKFNTHRLHKAALFAKDEGKYYEFAKEAFKTIFEYGKNVGEPVIVNEIGLSAGINITEMNRCIDGHFYNEKMEDAKKLWSIYEIESVPTFIVDENKKVTLLKDYERFKKDLLD
ncbi:DsbA family oxidoreductase [Schnuerera sp.]|uniref:DsbA family oxidoreductase n=1 Tax=Schnuerera sp. TaxID=2794844 RepID=UPI002B82C7A7|nr:DsbA family protein [Schnuerera sp.]HSH36258.1 DsbA family protein [Schnuerera sp.]